MFAEETEAPSLENIPAGMLVLTCNIGKRLWARNLSGDAQCSVK